MLKEGKSSRTIALSAGCSKTTVNNYRHRSGVNVADPRILFFDVESTPSIAATFQRFKVNIGPDAVIQEGGWLLSISWKWNNDSKVHGIALTPEEAVNQDDSRLVACLYDLFQEADYVVAHNGAAFDVPLFKTRLLANGFPPPKTVKVVDTLQIAKKLRFNSNKLDSLGHYLGVGRKLPHTGIRLWLDCMDGVQSALDDMLAYNKQDVILLEEVYNQLRAFDTKAPNAGHYFDDNQTRCVVCGSTNLVKTGNVVYTSASAFEEHQCEDCGARSRTRNSINSKEKRKSLLQNIV
jgi:DNA polymerase III epsilon subunit-like protein